MDNEKFIECCRDMVYLIHDQVFKKRYLNYFIYMGKFSYEQNRNLELILFLLLKKFQGFKFALKHTKAILNSIEGLIYGITKSSLWVYTFDTLRADDCTSIVYEHIYWYLTKTFATFNIEDDYNFY